MDNQPQPQRTLRQPQPATPQAPPTVIMEKPRESTLQETKQELRDAIQDSRQVLVSASTVFPLSFFPDTITVDRAKLTITRRTFFSTAEVMSIQIEDILNVTAQVGPFFGSIKITSRILTAKQPHVVDHFWRADAMKIKRITQGYIIALQKKIDCSRLGTAELSAMLDKLGQDDHA